MRNNRVLRAAKGIFILTTLVCATLSVDANAVPGDALGIPQHNGTTPGSLQSSHGGRILEGHVAYMPLPVCGDGHVDPGEQCDPPGLNCDDNCQWIIPYVGAARIESQAWWAPGDPPVDAPNIMSVVNLIKYQDATRSVALETLAYNAFSEPEVFDWQQGWDWQRGYPVIAIPLVVQNKQGVTSEIAVQNVVPWPGFVDFAVELYDQNGQIDHICEKLNEKQVKYIDLSEWKVVQSGFLGSAIIRPTNWYYVEGRALPYLAAVGVERVGRVLSDPDIPGDESKGFEGFPIAWWGERSVTSCYPD